MSSATPRDIDLWCALHTFSIQWLNHSLTNPSKWVFEITSLSLLLKMCHFSPQSSWDLAISVWSTGGGHSGKGLQFNQNEPKMETCYDLKTSFSMPATLVKIFSLVPLFFFFFFHINSYLLFSNKSVR